MNCDELRRAGLHYHAAQAGCGQREIKDLTIEEMSGVDSPASGLPGWMVMKSERRPEPTLIDIMTRVFKGRWSTSELARVKPYSGRGYGKGMVTPDGTVLTWATSQAPDGEPNHAAMRNALSVPYAAGFRINPDGTFRFHNGVPKDRKLGKHVEKHTGLKYKKKTIEEVAKAVNARHSIYAGANEEPPSLADPDNAKAVTSYDEQGIEDTRSNENEPAQSATVLEARDISNMPHSFNEGQQESNHALQEAYPGAGRDATRPVQTADAHEMAEGIDLTSPGTALPKLYQRYGAGLLKMPRHVASAGAVNPGIHPDIRRVLRRRANG